MLFNRKDRLGSVGAIIRLKYADRKVENACEWNAELNSLTMGRSGWRKEKNKIF